MSINGNLRTIYSRAELLAEETYVERITHDGIRFHGGFDGAGRYLTPRSRFRIPAIAAWTAQLAARGAPTRVLPPEDIDLTFFPNVAQTKLLLRRGARGAMTRILTLIGITEGFGNDGLNLMPRLDWQRYLVEPVAGTCLAHLNDGLFEAHGYDEAGCGDEAGHDGMWFALRDAALDHPEVTPDMWQDLPIAPPPGYSGPAKAAADAISVGQMQMEFPTVDPILEILLMALTQLLFIELVAAGTFRWAREVLSDPECSSAPEFAPRTVACISADEDIHVAYLQCALAELRARTVIAQDGSRIPGEVIMASICQKILNSNRDGQRRARLLRYRMNQIRAELAARSDGEAILAEFGRLGPVPQ